MRSSTEAAAWEISLAGRDLSPTVQQKDNLCGPFHAARVLSDAGVTEWEGEPLDQDLVALHAGTSLPHTELEPQVPPGARNLRDYRYELPRVDPDRSGTPAGALAAAIEKLSAGRLTCVPVSGEWTGERVAGLLDAVGERDVRLIANLRTGQLWASRPPLAALLAVLDGAEVSDRPAADWDAGHFVELVQLLRGRRGALVMVRDSYPSLGWEGIHLQPPEALASALMRGDGRQGGVLAVAAPAVAGEIEQLAGELGLRVKIWDN